ncbi:hypothetical protein BJ742DRAFT_838978 [Cladochytrium replicatum]|nr:hypothetical protein BJ742DRAFT_838978 [Cladochytrium replicatum]
MTSASRSRSSFRPFSVFKQSQDGGHAPQQPPPPSMPTNAEDPWSLKDLETMFTSWDPVSDSSPPVPDPLPSAPPTPTQTFSSGNDPRPSPRTFRGAIGFRSHKSRDTLPSQSDTLYIPNDPNPRHSRPSSLSSFSPQTPPASPAQMKNDSASTKSSPKNGAANLIKSVSNDLKRSINGSKRKTVAVSRFFSNGEAEEQQEDEGKGVRIRNDGAVDSNVIPLQPAVNRSVPGTPSFDSLRSNETLKPTEDESSSPSTRVPTPPDSPISLTIDEVAPPPLPEKDVVYLLPSEVPASVTVKQMILPHRARRTVDPALLEALAAESGIFLDRALLEEVLGEWGATSEIDAKGLEMHGQRSLDARAGMIKLYRERLMKKLVTASEGAREVGVVEGVSTQVESARAEEEMNRWMFESARRIPVQKLDETVEKVTIESEEQGRQEISSKVPGQTGLGITMESGTSREVTEDTEQADFVKPNISMAVEEVPDIGPTFLEASETVVTPVLDSLIEESADEVSVRSPIPAEDAVRQTSTSPSPPRPTSRLSRIPQFANRRTSAYSAPTADPAPRDSRRFSSATQLFSFSRSPSAASTVVAPPLPASPTPRSILRTDEEIASLESVSNSHEFTRAAASLELIALRRDDDRPVPPPSASRIPSPRASRRPETYRNSLLPREQQMRLVARVQPGARVALRRGKDGSVQLWAATSVEVEQHPPPMPEPSFEPVLENVDGHTIQHLQMQDSNAHHHQGSVVTPSADPNQNPQEQQLYALPVQQPDGTLVYQYYYFVPPQNQGEPSEQTQNEELRDQTQTGEQTEDVAPLQTLTDEVDLARENLPSSVTAVS